MIGHTTSAARRRLSSRRLSCWVIDPPTPGVTSPASKTLIRYSPGFGSQRRNCYIWPDLSSQFTGSVVRALDPFVSGHHGRPASHPPTNSQSREASFNNSRLRNRSTERGLISIVVDSPL